MSNCSELLWPILFNISLNNSFWTLAEVQFFYFLLSTCRIIQVVLTNSICHKFYRLIWKSVVLLFLPSPCQKNSGHLDSELKITKKVLFMCLCFYCNYLKKLALVFAKKRTFIASVFDICLYSFCLFISYDDDFNWEAVQLPFQNSVEMVSWFWLAIWSLMLFKPSFLWESKTRVASCESRVQRYEPRV